MSNFWKIGIVYVLLNSNPFISVFLFRPERNTLIYKYAWRHALYATLFWIQNR